MNDIYPQIYKHINIHTPPLFFFSILSPCLFLLIQYQSSILFPHANSVLQQLILIKMDCSLITCRIFPYLIQRRKSKDVRKMLRNTLATKMVCNSKLLGYVVWYVVCLELWLATSLVLLLSCFVLSGALQSPILLLPCSIIKEFIAHNHPSY